MTRLVLGVLALSGCTSLEGWTRDLGRAAARLDDGLRWSSPGRSFQLRQAFRGQWGFPVWYVDSDFSPWCEGDCRDEDEDGLDDDWEDAAVDYLRPAMQFHPDEPMLDDPDDGVVTVARVAPSDNCPGELRVYLAFLYDDDPGRCSIARHHGDVERMTLALVPTGNGNEHEVRDIYTAAHEGTSFDTSGTYAILAGQFTAIEDRITGKPRMVVLVAAGKHATYAASLVFGCEQDANICLKDVCRMVIDDPVVIAAANVGEPEHPRPSPPGIDAWSEARFCGAAPLGPLSAPCAPPIREKLLADPLGDCAPRPDYWTGADRPLEFISPSR